ncbi:MAG: dephospho-CoA kinase [Lachnospiraceae bacterium]|nr:dephospho-CoA kinase [Lachnospiraceae bacterium]
MKVIGITGGIGAGKTAVLSYISQKYNCRIVLADEAAHMVKEPGQNCYNSLVKLLGKDVLKEDQTIDKQKMAEKIFTSPFLLEQVNNIIHPAVKKLILNIIEEERISQVHDFLFIEAALLIEGGYLEIVDELWYIYAKEEVRRRRLKEIRGYSDEKIDSIMEKQLKEDEFRRYCRVVIDNSGVLSDAYCQIDEKLGEYLWQS